jgi:excisionase family DNA binding protein
VTTPLLLSVDDAAQALGIGHALAWQLIAAEQIETVRIGRRRLVPREALETYVAQLRANT